MGLDVQVDIKAEDIEAAVVKAIAESAFGEKMKVAVEEALKSLGSRYSYDNELKKWVEAKMREIVIEYVTTNYSEQIEQQIRQWLTSEKLKGITDEVISSVVSKLTTRSY